MVDCKNYQLMSDLSLATLVTVTAEMVPRLHHLLIKWAKLAEAEDTEIGFSSTGSMIFIALFCSDEHRAQFSGMVEEWQNSFYESCISNLESTGHFLIPDDDDCCF